MSEKQPRYSASPALHVLVPANTSQLDSYPFDEIPEHLQY